ncbi:MAG: peptidoglycan-associated lipoprotein Pal [Candidatus Ratteibacteria bacterium]|jgi:peptidoglycan-associated lipoprotein
MRKQWMVVGISMAILFSGCTAFKKRVPGESPARVSSSGEIVTPSTTAKKGESPAVVSSQPQPSPKDAGKATPTEIARATAGKDIPQHAPSHEQKFLAPSGEAAKVLVTIYFDFDDYSVKPVYRDTLLKIAEYLLANSHVSLLIEGHCDDRGTEEYNLVLGEQRALSVRRYLTGLGVSPQRLFTVSYGEEKPVDPAQNEEAWAKNRRAEFKVSTD